MGSTRGSAHARTPGRSGERDIVLTDKINCRWKIFGIYSLLEIR